MDIISKALKTIFTGYNYFNPPKHKAPEIVGKTERGVMVRANSGVEALDVTVKGQTAEGNSTFAAIRQTNVIHHGQGLFEVRRVEFDNSDLEKTKPRKVIQR